jgi:hypothetical protein
VGLSQLVPRREGHTYVVPFLKTPFWRRGRLRPPSRRLELSVVRSNPAWGNAERIVPTYIRKYTRIGSSFCLEIG